MADTGRDARLARLANLAADACKAQQVADDAAQAFFDAAATDTSPNLPYGQRVPVQQLAERLGIPRATLQSRLRARSGLPTAPPATRRES